MMNLQVNLTADTKQFDQNIQNSKRKLDNLNTTAFRASKINLNNTQLGKVTQSFKNLGKEGIGFVNTLALLSPTVDKIVSSVEKVQGALKLNTVSNITSAIATDSEKIAKSIEKINKFKKGGIDVRLAEHFLGKAEKGKDIVQNVVLAQSFMQLGEVAQKVSDKIVSLPFIPKSIKNNHAIKKQLGQLRKSYSYLNSIIDTFRKQKDISMPALNAEGEEIIVESLKDIEIEMAKIENKAIELNEKLVSPFKKAAIGAKELGNKIGGLIKKFGQLFLAITNVLILIKAVKWANQIAAINAEIDDNAQKANMTTQQYQKWSYVMKMAGSDVSVLRTSISQLTLRIKESEKGSNDALYGFQRLGVSVYDANGELRDTTSIFEDTVVALQKIENTTTRAAIASSIFGRNASELNGLLNMSAKDMEKLVKINNNLALSATDAAIAISGSFEDAKDTLSAVGQSFKSTIGEIMLPLLTKLISAIIIAIAYINIFIRTIFGLSLDKATGAGKATKNMNGFGASMGKAQKTAEKLKKTIASFDELNILGGKDSGGGSGSGIEDIELPSFGGWDGDASSFDFISDEQLDKIDAFRKKMAELQPTIQMCAMIASIIAGLFLVITGFMSGSILRIVNGLALIGIGIAIGMGGEEGETPFDKIKNAILDFQKFIQGSVIAQIAAIIVGISAIVLGFLTSNIPLIIAGAGILAIGIMSIPNAEGVSLFDKITKSMQDFEGLSAGVIAGLTGFFGLIGLVVGVMTGNILLIGAGIALIGVAIAQGFKQDANGESLFGNLTKDMSKFKNNVQVLITSLAAFFGLIALVIGIIGFNPALIAGGAALVGVAVLAGLRVDENGKSLFDKIVDKVQLSWKNLTGWWDTTVKPVFTKKWWTDKFQCIKGSLSDVGSWIRNKIDNFFTNTIRKVSTKVREIKDTIVGIFTGGNNKNNKDGGNKKQKKAPPRPAPQLSNLTVPAFASGGVVKAPTLGLVGEYQGARSNPEIIAPQSVITDIIDSRNDEMISVITQLFRQTISAIENQDLNVSIGDETIARSAARGNKANKYRTGKSLF